MTAIEAARRHALAACAVCAAGIVALAPLAYWVGPLERLDEQVLNAVSTPSGSLVHDLAFAIEQPMEPAGWAAITAAAFLLASWQGRHKLALFAIALIVGTGLIDLILKAAFEHSRPQSIPVGEFEWFPTPSAYPSGHTAGAIAISLAFLFVVPASWRRPTAVAGVVFTFAVVLGLLVLNYHYPSDIAGGVLLAFGWWFALLAVDADREPVYPDADRD